jgi:hypothetical protein
MKGYPRRFLSTLIVVFAALTVTGLLLVPTVLDLRFGFDVIWRLSGGQRSWIGGLHTGTAFFFCCLAGAVWSIHMRVGWRSSRHVLSGVITVGLLGSTALSALGILYFGDQSWLVSASAAHVLVGLFGVVCAGLHWTSVVIERSRRRGIRSAERDRTANPKPSIRLVHAREEQRSARDGSRAL